MVAGHDRPGILLETLRNKFLRDELPSDGEYRTLLAFSSHPDRHLREAALALLLHPPVTDLMSAYRNLLEFLAPSGLKGRELPLPLWELLCEFLTVCGQLPREPAAARFLEHLLKHLPPALMRILRHQSLPLEPVLAHLRLLSFGVRRTVEAPRLKHRWRFLRKRLMAVCAGSSWALPTVADLGGLYPRKPAGRRLGTCSGRWLAHGRALLLPEAVTFPPLVSMPLHQCTWGCADTGERRYLERLLTAHGEEVQAVRELAQAVSRQTRRVVLSWHNATLAASSGWAFEDLRAQFPSQVLWDAFEKAVSSRLQSGRNATHRSAKAVRHLGDQRLRRLALPKLYHALWEGRARALLDGTGEAEWQKQLQAVQSLFGLGERDFFETSKGYGWSGPVSPHQSLALEAVMNWSAGQKRTWHDGLLRLAALLCEGQSLLDRGLLPHLVLPWIDKFFMSSRRESDWPYLTNLVGWLAGRGTRPLILFWEDTPHREEPSLKLVLKRLHGRGYPFRGLGVFDWRGSSRPEALQIISREHRQVLLFALRPYRDRHNFHSLRRLLEDRPYGFFQDYDSSWKDGLCFLYAGTQVVPLLSVPTDRENVPAWIGAAGGRFPFGSYWRHRLREAVLGKKPENSDSLAVTYATWANLC